MSPIRILYLIDHLSSSRGGTEQHLFWLLRHFPRKGFEGHGCEGHGCEGHCIVFSHTRGTDPARLPAETLVFGDLYGHGKWNWWKRLRHLARYLGDHEIDVVQAFSPLGELAGLLATRLARRGCLLGNRRDCGYHINRESRTIYRLLRLFGTRFVANSEAARQAAHRLEGTPLDRIEVIRNPLPEERLREAMAKKMSRAMLPFPPGADPGAKLVGMVATVRPVKDHETLLKAVPAVLAAHPETYFPMVGEQLPEHLAHLRKMAEELRIDRHILWCGGLENPLRMMPLFDVGALSSHSESFSNAVLEYAAVGLPAVVTDVGGLGEIVREGETGFLVPPRDPGTFAERLIRLLDDDAVRKRMGENGRRFVGEHFAEPVILEQYAELYRKIAGKKS
ncbi:MAG TPA: hypothetical protein DEB39_03360 [Planctomycetaceae bacterium]|nr:hypothetical protein [Planctomycetaceae bacterium]